MSHPPPSNPPRNQSSSAPPMSEDYGDFEGDPTSINQIPSAQAQGMQQPSRPSNGLPPTAQPGQFASASPSLSHIGAPPPQQQYGTNPGLAGPGAAMVGA
ncbi:MAG TPA: hypothetical protein VK607_12570, partial [Kofleriaceae bacterium]|nr:hypothetical protein [Kofleriaceae bacterium]